MLHDSAILYRNSSNSIVLLDIPTSIVVAQKGQDGPPSRVLLSCEPLFKPYSSNEPKSEAARQRLVQTNQVELTIDHAIDAVATIALAQIKANYQGKWCLDRHVASEAKPPQLSGANGGHPKNRHSSHSKHASGLQTKISPRPNSSFGAPPPLILSSSENYMTSWNEIHGNVVINSSSQATIMNIGTQVFFVPPSSRFLLSLLEQSQSTFIQLTQKLLPATSSHGAGDFDFILLDPPWSNRSVRRSAKYVTAEFQHTDPWVYLSSFLGNHLAPTGLVAVWISNKSVIRSQVLQTFQEWGVTLVEVWIWVKATIDGDPVLPLDGLWRKPYEMLLLGRRDADGKTRKSTANDEVKQFLDAQKRVIVAVPDLHSRKPCVKELIEAVFFNNGDYRALEVFARNLNAGWWSWGDEVLKFNWEGHWETFSP